MWTVIIQSTIIVEAVGPSQVWVVDLAQKPQTQPLPSSRLPWDAVVTTLQATAYSFRRSHSAGSLLAHGLDLQDGSRLVRSRSGQALEDRPTAADAPYQPNGPNHSDDPTAPTLLHLAHSTSSQRTMAVAVIQQDAVPWPNNSRQNNPKHTSPQLTVLFMGVLQSTQKNLFASQIIHQS